MKHTLQRLFQARSIAVFGSVWAENLIEQLKKSHYAGQIWAIHPTRDEIAGIKTFANLAQLPAAPDAAFVGVNRLLSIDIVKQLADMGAGGAICFASGFKEAAEHHDDATNDLQAQLLQAAGDMPILGPNCYGFINYLDNVVMWPDQHGGRAVDKGVAIIAQSSNMAINLTMQRRGLAIAKVITVGNQANVGISELISEMVYNEAITAIGVYCEGIDDLAKFAQAAQLARAANKPIVLIKAGKTEKSRLASITHTASLTGNATASSAMLKRLGIGEVHSLDVFLETLKLLHQLRRLNGDKIVSVSCSGGEASLMADTAHNSAIQYADFSETQTQQLQKILGSKVGIANPLDYHTYIWGDETAMTACFTAVASGDFDLSVFVLDIPREDLCDTHGQECALQSIINARQNTHAPIAVLASIPETLNETLSLRLVQAGVVPLHGMQAGVEAISAVIDLGARLDNAGEIWISPSKNRAITKVNPAMINEYQAKQALAEFGVAIPASVVCASKSEALSASHEFFTPYVLKGLFEQAEQAHKTEANAVYLGLDSPESCQRALHNMPDCPAGYLLEEMISDKCLELLIGITIDETGVVLLTIGAGGIFTEIMADTVALALPATDSELRTALQTLKCARLFTAYRQQAPANLAATVQAIRGICDYAYAHLDSLLELDVNPLIVGVHNAVACDALIIHNT